MNYAKFLAVLVLLATPAIADTVHDGSHDFDFALGTFHTHIRRLLNPLTGSTRWVEYDGTKTDRLLLSDTGNLETIEADGPDHLELMTLCLYSTAAHQWSLNFSSSDSGQMTTPAIGEFENGVGTFVDQENYRGARSWCARSGRRSRPSPIISNRPSPPISAGPGNQISSPT